MKTLPILAALSASLLLAGIPAIAQAPAKAKPAPAAANAAASASYKEAKLAAIEAWIAANKSAADRSEALYEAAMLAYELQNWNKSRTFADQLVKEFPKDEHASEMKLTSARAQSFTPGGETAARKAFESLVAGAGGDIRLAYDATMGLVDLLAGMGEIDGAKQAVQTLADKYKDEEQLGQELEGKLAELDQYGKPPKAIDVLGYDGKPINLEDLKGKVVLIDFWATWCGPCRAELPNVIATYKKYHSQGFEIVGISLDSDEAKLKEFLATHDMPWAQFYDGKGWKNEVGQLYGVNSIPQTYLLDKEGNVRAIGVREAALGIQVAKLIAPKG